MAVISGAARADISYLQPLNTPLTFPNGGGGFGVAAGDFNGDGKPDIAVTANPVIAGVGTRGYIYIMLGKGDCTFNAPTGIALPDNPSLVFAYGIVARDFNGDGKLDLAVASWEQQAVGILLGNGNGTFQAPVWYSAGARAYMIQVGDVNGDGKLDLVTGNQQNNTVSVLRGNGNGTFQAATVHALPDYPSGLQVVDLNGDGKLDIMVGHWGRYSASELLNDGAGNFPASSTEYNVRSQAGGLQVADFLGNGKPDLAIFGVVPSGYGFGILPGIGDGTYAVPADTNFTWYNPGILQYTENKPLDLNFDGKPDLHFIDYPGHGANEVSIGLNLGGGAFDMRSYVAGVGPGGTSTSGEAINAYASLAVDLNNDGALDLVNVFNGGSSGGVCVVPGIPGAPGTFRSPRVFGASSQITGYSRPTAIGDFNGDGKPDIAFITDCLSISIGNGDGTFTPSAWGVGHIGGTGEGYNTIKTGDFNGDGKLDVIFNATGGVQAGPPPRTVVAYNNGNGTFTLSVFQNAAQHDNNWGGTNIAVGDLNGDGYDDFAIYIGYGQWAGIQAYLGGPGGLTTAQWIDLGVVGDYPGTGMVIADVDGDGKADLVTHVRAISGVNGGKDRLLLYHGNGNGTFAAPRIIGNGWGFAALQELRAADMNKDGIMDLVAADPWGGIYVMTGKGAGAFNTPISINTGGFNYDIAIYDVDGDGILDVCVGGRNGYCVLPGNGTGYLGDPIRFAVGNASVFGVHLGDVDGDGKVDVTVAHDRVGTTFNYLTPLKNLSTPAALLPKAFTISPASVTGGAQTSKGTVTLTKPAPIGGKTFTITTDRPSWQVIVPATVTVPAGKTSATFNIGTIYGNSQYVANITVKGMGFTFLKALTIKPIVPATLTLNPTAVNSNGTTTATVALSFPAEPGDLNVSLSSSNTSVASVPSSVTVSHTTNSATFTVTAKAVTVKKTVAIKATLNGTTKSVTLTVNP